MSHIDMLRAMEELKQRLRDDSVHPLPKHLYVPGSIARRMGWVAKWARNGTVCWGRHVIPGVGTATVFTCEPGQGDFGDPDAAS